MSWQSTKEYESLLGITNAIITQKTREGLFRAIVTEIKKLFHYDRCSIQLYDPKTKSLSYFVTAEGIKPDGISCETSRPLSKGSIANLVIESGKPIVIKDLSKYGQLTTAGAMIKENLTSTIAFPLIIRHETIGTIHFSFKKCPKNIEELSNFVEELCEQISIAVDNMLSYDKLRIVNEKLEQQKGYVLERLDKLNREFYFTSPKITKLMKNIDLIADSDTSVLITGETGTGKDHIARYIHNISSRRENLFIKVNCAALVPSLIESELFGHAKGAFTGASIKRTGRFEMADGGTIFLDEIGELPLQSQAKLLQVLEDKCFERVGESTPILVDLRIISATNQNLTKRLRDGTLRRDLFYRINTFHIEIPPLRKRIEDIDLLTRCFTTRFAEMMQRPEARYSQLAIETLRRYRWPGNVRELQNVVERIMILRSGQTVTEMDIKQLLHPFQLEEARNEESRFLTRDEMEKKHIEEALARCVGVIGGRHGAAQLLGIPRSTLQYRMKKLGIEVAKHPQVKM